MSKKIGISVAMSVGIFLVMLDTTIMNIALPAIQKGIDVDFSKLTWALNIYTIIFATLTIPLSRVGDIFGKNKIYLVGLILFGCGSLMSGCADSFCLLVIGRSISSFGASILLPLGNSIGISVWAMKDRFKIIAILGLAQGGAAAIGPTLGGLIINLSSWHWIFLVNIPIVIIGIILSIKYLDSSTNTQLNEKIDFLGSILSMISLFSLTLGLIKVRDWGLEDIKSIGCFLLSFIFLLLFIVAEKKVTFPMIDLKLFKIKSFTISSIVAMLAQFFYIGVVVVIPTYLTDAEKYTELKAGLILLPMSLAVFALGGLGSLAINKLGPRILVFAGLGSILLSYILLVKTSEKGTLFVIIALIVLGIGFGLIAGPVNILAASNLSGPLLTSSQSVITVVRQIGSVLGVSIFISNMSSNIGSLTDFSKKGVSDAYLSIYTIWIPILFLLLLITFLYPTKKNYLLSK